MQNSLKLGKLRNCWMLGCFLTS